LDVLVRTFVACGHAAGGRSARSVRRWNGAGNCPLVVFGSLRELPDVESLDATVDLQLVIVDRMEAAVLTQSNWSLK
jgi:hypothetical protein